MAEYARIAAEHEKPWEFFEIFSNGDWLILQTHPVWNTHTEFRLKPKIIRIGEIDVPEPMRSAPEIGSSYFVVDLCASSSTVVKSKWDDDWTDERCLERGMCHTTEEAAITHAKALILASGGVV